MSRVLMVLLLIVFSGCTATNEQPFAPSLTWGPCPAQVDAQFLSRHECGELTVLQDRNRPTGPRVRLLVLKVWPVGIEPKPGLALGFGGNPGDPGGFGGGIAAGATRAGTVVVDLAFRGSAVGSDPSLACPEVEGMSTSGVGDRDPGVRADFRAAVEACAARLRQSGVEPANFGPSAVIGDIEDFRRAIGVDSWLTGGSYGTMSRMLAGYLALHPDRAQIAFFDSPASPTLDPLTAGALGLDSALLALDRHNPGLLKAWKRALTTTGRQPLAANRGSVAIVVDDAKLVRLIRFALGGDGPRNVRYVPRMIAAAANGRLDPHLLSLAVSDPPFCAGYIPLCQNRPQYSLGAFLTDFCEQLPSDRAALERAIAGRPAYRKVFGESPYQEACAIWRVPSAPAKAAAPSLTPALLLTGEYDSFSRPEWAHAWAKQFRPASWSVSIPGQTHNVLGSSDCAIALRNAWRNNPGRLPDNTCANTRK